MEIQPEELENVLRCIIHVSRHGFVPDRPEILRAKASDIVENYRVYDIVQLLNDNIYINC